MIAQDTLARLQIPFGVNLIRTLGLRLLRFAPRQPRPVEPPPVEDRPLTRPYPWETSYPNGVAWDIVVPVRPLHALLDDAVARFANHTCVDCLDQRFTYADIARLVARAAKGLQLLGVGKGIRVGLLLPNTHFFVIAYYGVLKAGGTVVNLNPLYAEAEIRQILIDADVRIVVTMDQALLYGKFARALEGAAVERVVVARISGLLPWPKRGLYALFGRRERARIPRDHRHLTLDRLLANDGLPEPVAIDPPHDVAVLHYTGGIDGEPKAALLTHTNLYANALQARTCFPELVEGEERVLGVLPLCHVFGMSGVLNVGVLAGAALVLLPRFTVEETLRAIDRKKVTQFVGVPSMFAMLMGSRNLARYDLSSLRAAIAGGAPLSADLQRRFEALTGGRLVEGYGLTEAGPVVTCNMLSAGRRENSVGLPLPGTVVEIVSLEEPRRRLPAGTPGEVCVRGPQVMAGYWNRPAATRAVLRDGRLHTGDLGYLDEAGYLHLTGRSKRMVLVGGYNVYPNHVEAVIGELPAIAKVEVSGAPDRRLGERVRATIWLRSGATLTIEELREHLKDRLAPFAIPRDVKIVPAAEIMAADEKSPNAYVQPAA